MDNRTGSALERAFGGAAFACFLGLAATRVWLQCNLFGLYVQSDLGVDTMVNQLSYGFTFLVGALCVLVKRPRPQTERAIALVAVVLMTLCAAAALILPPGADGRLPLDVAAGIAGALGGAMWAMAYVRIDTRLAVPYSFASLALGSIAGWALSFATHEAAALVSIAMPALAFLCWQRSSAVPADTARCTPCYDREPATTYIYVFGGLVVFSFALGISRGYPAGEPVFLVPGLRAVHQWGVVAVSLALIWWSAFKRRQISFSLLWRIEICLVAAGVVILTMFPGDLDELAVAVVNIADTLMLGVLWVTAQDVSRHSSYHPFAVFGFAWAARVLARNAGRFMIGIVGTASQTANTAIGVLVLLLSLSVALLLSNGIPRTRALFSDDRLGVADGAQPARAASLAAQGSAQAGDAEGAVGSDAVPAVEAPAAFAQVQTVEAAAETRAERAAETPAGKGGENDAEGPANVRALNAVQESAAPVAKRTASAASAHAPAVGAAPSVRAAAQPARPAQGEPQAEGPAAVSASAQASARSVNGQATATQTAAAAPDARTPRERLVDWMADDRKLTQREIEVALLIATGRSKAVIAKKLFVSENTVRTHAKNAYAKLGVHSKQQLMDVLEAHMA